MDMGLSHCFQTELSCLDWAKDLLEEANLMPMSEEFNLLDLDTQIQAADQQQTVLTVLTYEGENPENPKWAFVAC